MHLGLSRIRECHRAEIEVWLRDVSCPSGGSEGDMHDQAFAGFDIGVYIHPPNASWRVPAELHEVYLSTACLGVSQEGCPRKPR